MRQAIKTALLSGLLMHSAALLASDDDDLLSLYDEEDLITIATGTQKQIRYAPSVASVITAQEIKHSGARNLSEVLERVPGLHVGDALLFDDDLISIRGIQSSNNPQVLVLIDGVEVRNLFTAARPNGFRLPLENVHRVEVIRGPGSAVYGADAFAGVINVITKTAKEINGVHVGGRVGNFNTQDAWFQSGIVVDDIELAFSHEYTKSDGDHNRKVAADGFGRSGRYRSEYEIYNTQLKVSLKDWFLRLHNWRSSNGGNGPGGAQILDSKGFTDADVYQFDIGYATSLDRDWDIKTRLGYNRNDTAVENTLFPAGDYQASTDPNNLGNILCPTIPGCPAFGPKQETVNFSNGVIGNPSGIQTIIDFDFSATFSGVSGHTLRFAAGYKNEDFDTSETKNFGPGVLNPSATSIAPSLKSVSNTSDVFVEDVDRDVYYVSLQDEWNFANDWALTWGVRFDEYSDVGGTINPRLALVWAADYNLTAKLLYGRAFRAPSFTELYSQNNPAQIGNEDLEPETIDTIEAALDYRVNADLNIIANVFYYEIDDLIDFAVFAQAQNKIDQKGKGIEISANWDLSADLVVRANASLQDIEDQQTGDSVADVPDKQVYLALDWSPVETIDVFAEVKWIGSRERAALDTRKDTEDFSVVNFKIQKDFVDAGVELGLIARNMFNESASEPAEFDTLLPFVSTDFPNEGRSLFVDLRYSFQ